MIVSSFTLLQVHFTNFCFFGFFIGLVLCEVCHNKSNQTKPCQRFVQRFVQKFARNFVFTCPILMSPYDLLFLMKSQLIYEQLHLVLS